MRSDAPTHSSGRWQAGLYSTFQLVSPTRIGYGIVRFVTPSLCSRPHASLTKVQWRQGAISHRCTGITLKGLSVSDVNGYATENAVSLNPSCPCSRQHLRSRRPNRRQLRHSGPCHRDSSLRLLLATSDNGFDGQGPDQKPHDASPDAFALFRASSIADLREAVGSDSCHRVDTAEKMTGIKNRSDFPSMLTTKIKAQHANRLACRVESGVAALTISLETLRGQLIAASWSGEKCSSRRESSRF